MDEMQKLINWILKVTVLTLASIMVAVVLVLMIGIFLPNDQIDNKDILALIGPAFNTVIGAFVGLLGGLTISGQPKQVDTLPDPTKPETTSEPEPDLGPHPDHPDEEL
jgi:hypothetical protein